MKTKPYPKYKPSGVEWLGNVPEHWGVKRLKNALFVFNGSTPESTKDEYWDGDIIWYTPEDLGSNGKKFISDSRRKITDEGCSSIGARITPPGSIIISTRAPIGHVAISSKFSCTNQGCRALVPNPNHISGYFYYFLLISKNLLNSIGKGTTFNELGTQGLSAYTILVPPLPEQQAIADFLDRETGRIDALIAKKERLLKLLAEQRAALISRAVSRGLDKAVKLKPSGVEWLGDIPGHWEVKRVKHIANIRYGVGEPPEYVEDGVAFIRATNINAGMIESENLVRINPEDIPFTRRTWLKTGDIIVVRSGAYTGDSAIIPEEYSGSIAGFDMVVSCRKTASSFLAYALLSKYLRDGQIFLQKMRAAQPHLNAEELGNCLVFLPPLTEQHAIADFLDRETTKIEALSGKVKEAIKKLREYRSALISATVTGKSCVKEVL